MRNLVLNLMIFKFEKNDVSINKKKKTKIIERIKMFFKLLEDTNLNI